MEGVIAKWYASLTRKSMDEFVTLAQRVAEKLPLGSRVLENRTWAGVLRDRISETRGIPNHRN